MGGTWQEMWREAVVGSGTIQECSGEAAAVVGMQWEDRGCTGMKWEMGECGGTQQQG